MSRIPQEHIDILNASPSMGAVLVQDFLSNFRPSGNCQYRGSGLDNKPKGSSALLGMVRGQWRLTDFAAGAMSPQSVVMELGGMSFREAFKYLAERLGLHDLVVEASRPFDKERNQPRQKNFTRHLEAQRQARAGEDTKRADQFSKADEIYSQASALEVDGPVWRYLTETRSLDLRSVYRTVMYSLQQHNALPLGGQILPGLITEVTDPATQSLIGIHVVYINAETSPPTKLKRLRWGSGLPEQVQAPYCAAINLTHARKSTHLAITEGVEDGLALLCLGWPGNVWACTSAGDMAKFPVLAGYDSLTVCADPGEVGLKAATTTARRWLAAGKDVQVRQAKDNDLNEVLRNQTHGYT